MYRQLPVSSMRTLSPRMGSRDRDRSLPTEDIEAVKKKLEQLKSYNILTHNVT